MNGNYRECAKCQEPVHRNRNGCPSCGGPSPWAAVAVDRQSVDQATPEVDPADHPMPDGTIVVPVSPTQMADLRGDSPPVPPGLGEHDFDPTDDQVAAFISAQPDHDALARDHQADIDRAMTGPHVFMEKFSCMVGPVMAHFKIGQVVTDFPLLMALKIEHAPMVPVASAPGMACCPKCLHVFSVPKVVPARRAG